MLYREPAAQLPCPVTLAGLLARMTPLPSSDARAVRRTFFITFLVLLVPSRFFALAHAPNLMRFAGATLSTVLVWWCLYRLCMRATRPSWFAAISIPALYISTFWAPAYAWTTLLVLLVVHRFLARYFPQVREPAPDLESRIDDDGREAVEGTSLVDTTASLRIVDLDRICTPYRRILFVLRIIRAGMASLVNSALLIGPAMFFFAVYDADSPVFGLVAGLTMAMFLGLLSVLCFAWLRALWQGSRRAALFTAVATSLFATFFALAGIATTDRELVATGGIWFHLSAYALQVALFTSLAIATAILVRRRGDEALMSLFRHNATYTWRESIQQLAGVVLPRARSFKALAHRSVVLSVLAFTFEGAAFYVYFDTADNLLKASDSVRAGRLSFFPGPVTLLEAHYLSLVTIAALLLPVLYVSTQMVLSAAEGMRRAARRASLRPAEEVLNEDPRPPVLFLRDFTDDQVALDKAALPGWVRVVDPGNAQTNLEDVMQAYATVGPMVAIGRPGDEQPPVGAARRYVQDGEWKSAVTSLMDSAAVIVVGVSDSAGVVWEIEQARDRGHLGKSVFVLPPTKRRNHLLTRQLVGRLLSSVDPIRADALTASLARTLGLRRVAGLTVRDGTVNLFVTERRPSQIEFDVTLRLSRPPAPAPAAQWNPSGGASGNYLVF